MAREFDLPEGKLFPGENKKLYFPITRGDNVTPEDATGWALQFFVRKEDKSAASIFEKSSAIPGQIAVVGEFDPDPEINTQRIEVTLESADTAAMKPNTYRYALERVDPGLKGVLAYGDFELTPSAAR